MNTRRYFAVLAILSAILLFAPLRRGGLAGYDDAQYAHQAKSILTSGDWLVLQSNGEPALENPPMLEWMEASLFAVFGYSDSLARLPSALCGWGVIFLVYWLARRLTGDAFTACLAMFVMATSLYFLKYAARGMTDVPFTFFTLCAVCAWRLADDHPRWYLAVGFSILLAAWTRSLMGMALPAIFALDLIWRRERPVWRYALPALAIVYLPLAGWYAYLIHRFGTFFIEQHGGWLQREVTGGLTPAWRRYTGAFEYAWMLAKSYWPWLPAMMAGLVAVARAPDRRLRVLPVWSATVFVLCAAARSRVLRYMLPAYPAFAVLAAIGLRKFVRERFLQTSLKAATAVFAVAVAIVAAFPQAHPEAAEVRAMAKASTAATGPGERVGLYDQGQPRFDEDNQMQWYGDRLLARLFTTQKLVDALHGRRVRVYVMDRDSYRTYISGQFANQLIAASGHLVCVKLLQ